MTITQRNATTPDGINLEGADYVTIDGFNVVGMPRTGIRSVINHDVILRNNNLDQNGYWGILTGFSDDLLIENNVASRSVQQHGIYVGNSGDRPIIRNNVLWGNHANGIHMNGDVSQGGDGIISGALVEDNIIYDNGLGGGSGINCDGVQNSLIRNNLIYNEHASGISLYQIDGGGSSTGNLVVNNTVLVAADGRWALNIQDGSTGNTVRNNILYNESLVPRQHRHQRRQPRRLHQRLQRRDGPLHDRRRRQRSDARPVAGGNRPGPAFARSPRRASSSSTPPATTSICRRQVPRSMPARRNLPPRSISKARPAPAARL